MPCVEKATLQTLNVWCQWQTGGTWHWGYCQTGHLNALCTGWWWGWASVWPAPSGRSAGEIHYGQSTPVRHWPAGSMLPHFHKHVQKYSYNAQTWKTLTWLSLCFVCSWLLKKHGGAKWRRTYPYIWGAHSKLTKIQFFIYMSLLILQKDMNTYNTPQNYTILELWIFQVQKVHTSSM